MHNHHPHPKFSIITVTYNAAKVLEDTIQSIVTQTYKNLEYIIVDGGSTDETLDIIHKYQEHITTVISEPDQGLYDAMNKGIKLATGDYEKGEADEDQSWKWQLEKKGWKVETHMKGLGDYKEINNIYLEHLKAAIADGNKE